MPATTVRRLIIRTLRGVGYLGRNAQPTAEDANDSFDTLVELMASWNRENLLHPYTLIQPVTTVISQSLYTVGSTGDVNVVRPDKIDYISIRLGTSPDYTEFKLYVANNEQEWQRIVSKQISTTRPMKAWYNPKFPLGELNIWPVPSEAGTLLLYLRNRFTPFATLDDSIEMEDGFLMAIRFNLGIKLQPEFGVKLPDGWAEQAISSKAVIKASNIQHGTLELETPGIGTRYWISTDNYY